MREGGERGQDEGRGMVREGEERGGRQAREGGSRRARKSDIS